MSQNTLLEKDLTGAIIGAFYDVYNTLGFGFLEAIYSAALERELATRGHSVAREYAVHVIYKGESLGFQRLNMVVDGRVVIEIKSTHVLAPTAQRQLMNYLRGTNLNVGLLLHFGPEPRFHRVVSQYQRHPPHPAPSCSRDSAETDGASAETDRGSAETLGDSAA